jgi:hypothetical protein
VDRFAKEEEVKDYLVEIPLTPFKGGVTSAVSQALNLRSEIPSFELIQFIS